MFKVRFWAIFVVIVLRIGPYHYEGREILNTMGYLHVYFGRQTTSIIRLDRRLENRAEKELTLTIFGRIRLWYTIM